MLGNHDADAVVGRVHLWSIRSRLSGRRGAEWEMSKVKCHLGTRIKCWPTSSSEMDELHGKDESMAVDDVGILKEGTQS